MVLEIPKLKIGETVLGTLHHPDGEFPWLKYDFVPTAEFSEYEPIFEKSYDMLNNGDPCFEKNFESTIATLELVIEPFNGGSLTKFPVHIYREDDEMYIEFRE